MEPKRNEIHDKDKSKSNDNLLSNSGDSSDTTKTNDFVPSNVPPDANDLTQLNESPFSDEVQSSNIAQASNLAQTNNVAQSDNARASNIAKGSSSAQASNIANKSNDAQENDDAQLSSDAQQMSNFEQASEEQPRLMDEPFYDEERDEEYASELAEAPGIDSLARRSTDAEKFDGSRDWDAADTDAGRLVGWAALAMAIVSLFVWPAFFGPAAAITGFVAWTRGSRTLGVWSIALGLISFVLYLFLAPFNGV